MKKMVFALVAFAATVTLSAQTVVNPSKQTTTTAKRTVVFGKPEQPKRTVVFGQPAPKCTVVFGRPAPRRTVVFGKPGPRPVVIRTVRHDDASESGQEHRWKHGKHKGAYKKHHHEHDDDNDNHHGDED